MAKETKQTNHPHSKGSLSLVGLGIGGERTLTLEGLDILKSSDKIFAESYTNLLPDSTIARLENLVGKKITLLGREVVEGEKVLLEAAALQHVSLVVPGDPMIATTHVSLLLAAKKCGIQTRTLHSSSILSAAIGESGLQAYKFGKMVTLAYWRDNYKPMAAYEVIAENLSRNLHTLLLLDIDEKLGPMAPSEAAALLLEMEEAGKRGIVTGATRLVVLEKLGRAGQSISFQPINQITGDGPACLVFPGRLHFLEKDFLESL